MLNYHIGYNLNLKFEHFTVIDKIGNESHDMARKESRFKPMLQGKCDFLWRQAAPREALIVRIQREIGLFRWFGKEAVCSVNRLSSSGLRSRIFWL
nr:hypothetical protein [uncultured Cohaesibacter sp.]